MSKTKKTMSIAQIERMLKSDIKWAITKGPGWDSGTGSTWDFEIKEWIPSIPQCGVCAIGALCVRRQPKRNRSSFSDVSAAATLLGRPYSWVNDLYFAVLDPQSAEHSDVRDLANRLREYAKEVGNIVKRLRVHAKKLKKGKRNAKQPVGR